MFRLFNLRLSQIPNTMFSEGNLIAIHDIRKGHCIRTPAPGKTHRTKEERKEIDRLAEMSYKHALQ